MRPRILFCLLLLAACFDAAASDIYTTVNRLRAGEGDCSAAKKMPPLVPQGALERVASDLSRGVTLQQSLKETGYRASRSSVLSINGDGAGAQAAELLAKYHYCEQLQDAAVTEVGVYLDARQVWIVLAAPFAPAAGASGHAAGQRVLDLVNQARAAPRYCGNQAFNAARPLRWNDALAEASRLHAEDMARHNYFSHTGRDGSQPWDRAERAGYRFGAFGENIAAGQATPDDAVAGWIKSPPHCANLMNPAFTETGSAFATDPRSELGIYWTQAFGAPR